jgi:predicted nuclease of predicted toxin-antitoxin system
MKFLIDMNLSPKWCEVLHAEGWESAHWSEAGGAAAPDLEIMRHAISEKRCLPPRRQKDQASCRYGRRTFAHRACRHTWSRY